MLKHLTHALEIAAYCFLVLTGLCIPLSITATDICMAITAALGVLSGLFFRYFEALQRNPLTWCALWLVILVTIALFWSVAPWGDRLSALHKYSKLLYIPLLLVVCTDSKWRDRAIITFLFSVLITVLISYLKAWTGWHIGIAPDPAVVFYSHIETSFLVAFATYLLALYALKKPRWRIPCILLIVIFTYQEFFINNGRTGWVAYLILLLLFTVQWTGWKGLVAGVAAAGILFISFYYISPTFQTILQRSVQDIQQYKSGQIETSLGYRLSFDSLSWRLIKQRPVLGYGTGSFATASQQAGGLPGWKILRTPHNEYMMVLVEFGLIGLLSLLALFYYQFRLSFGLSEMRFFAQGLVLVFAVSSVYNAFLYLSVSGHFYMLFTALFYGGLLNYKDSDFIPISSIQSD